MSEHILRGHVHPIGRQYQRRDRVNSAMRGVGVQRPMQPHADKSPADHPHQRIIKNTVTKHTALRFRRPLVDDFYQFDFESQGRAGRNRTAAAIAIGKIGRTRDLALAAFLHHLDRLAPARNNITQ